jgi:hypothetical protein
MKVARRTRELKTFGMNVTGMSKDTKIRQLIIWSMQNEMTIDEYAGQNLVSKITH